MDWWKRMTLGRRILLVVVLLCLLGIIGSFVWDYSVKILIIVTLVASVVNTIWSVRDSMRTPAPGREDTSPPRGRGTNDENN